MEGSELYVETSKGWPAASGHGWESTSHSGPLLVYTLIHVNA